MKKQRILDFQSNKNAPIGAKSPLPGKAIERKPASSWSKMCDFNWENPTRWPALKKVAVNGQEFLSACGLLAATR